MSLRYRRDRRRWVADIVDPRTGKRSLLTLSVSDPTARADAELAWHQAMADRGTPARQADGLPLGQLIKRHLDWCQAGHVAPRTTETRRTYLRWIPDDLLAVDARDITPEDIDRVKAAHVGNAPRSINHFVSNVKGIYNWAVTQRLMAHSPIQGVQKVLLDPPVKRARTADLLETVYAHADAEFPVLGRCLRFLALTGMRVGEFVPNPRWDSPGALWTDYHGDQRILVVVKHKTARYTGQPRMIALSDAALSVLLEFPGWGTSIVSYEDGRPVPVGTLDQQIRKLRERHPETERFRGWHDLRHTFASRAADRGVPVDDLAAYLGHGSTAMTLYYVKRQAATLRGVAEAVAGNLHKEIDDGSQVL